MNRKAFLASLIGMPLSLFGMTKQNDYTKTQQEIMEDMTHHGSVTSAVSNKCKYFWFNNDDKQNGFEVLECPYTAEYSIITKIKNFEHTSKFCKTHKNQLVARHKRAKQYSLENNLIEIVGIKEIS